MIITYFHHAGDNVPAHSEVPWDVLANSLNDVRPTQCTLENCRRSECPHKNGPAWSAARYKDNTKRGLNGVLDVHALIVDIDHVKPEQLELFLDKVKGYQVIIHSSHSDNPSDRCLRIIICLSRPVLLGEWYRFWAQVIEDLQIPADTQTRDPSRLFYLPSRPMDACNSGIDGSGFLFASLEGKSIDVDEVLARAPATPTYEISEGFDIPEFTGAPSQKKLENAINLLSGAWPDSGRNTCQLALCGALARAGWPVELITDFVEAVCELARPGNGDRAKRAKAARASLAKIQAGEMVAGWPTVEEFVDPEIVKQVTSILGLGGPKHDQTFVDAFKMFGASELSAVVISRDDIDCTLRAARQRLGRSSNPKKKKEALVLGRALDGKPLTEHAEDDVDQLFLVALKTIVRHAPRGSSSIILAEYLTKSRPDIPLDTLCEMVEQAKGANYYDDKAELPLDEFIKEFAGPRMGKPIAGSQHNFDIALRRLNVDFYFDSFARRKIMERTIDGILYRNVCEDRHYNKLMFEIERTHDFYPPKDKFYDYCADRGYQNEFHPVQDYLDGLPAWDGESRCEEWLIRYGGAPDTPYVRAVSRLVLVAAVRRVRQPGCKFDEMLILESPQGSGKSTAIKALCPNVDWFADNFRLDGDTKKMIEQTLGKWIVEAGELRGMTARDQNDLKAYLSSTHDEARMAYAREPQRLPRQFIIIGTTNDTQYLKDHTGDRRYWPVKIGKFKVDELIVIRDQLWAEANYLEMSNPVADYIRLDPDLYGDAAIEQQHRKVENAIKIHLEDKLDSLTGRISIPDVWKIVTEEISPQQHIITQVGSAMHELGWVRERIRVNGKKTYYYVKGSEEEQSKLLLVTGNLGFGITIKVVDTDSKGNPLTEESKLTAN